MRTARVSLGWVVSALTFSVLAPLAVMSVLSVQRTWHAELANLQQQNVATVRAVSVAVDQEVENTTASLDVLASLHALDAPDLVAFDSLAQRLLARRPDWAMIVLADAAGRILATTPGEGFAQRSSTITDWARSAAQAKGAVVSNLFEVPGVRGHFVTVAVPVIREGHGTLAIGARLRSDSFSAILREQKAPPRGVVAVVDAAHHIVARTGQEDEYVGTSASQAFIDVLKHTQEGSWQTEDRNGTPVYSAFSRSPRTGLTVGLAVPREEMYGPVRRILWSIAALWAGVLVVGATAALLLGQLVVRAMTTASQAAMTLARGQPLTMASSRISQIDDLSSGLRQAAATLDARNRERDEAARLKDEFLMTVSHELRTPLTAIFGWARMLATGQIRDGQQTRAIAAIERNAGALQTLVNDLLDVSRVVSGKLRLDMAEVSVSAVLNAAIDAIRPAADAKRIAIAIRNRDRDAAVAGDAARLQQVLWNLLANAVKFTPEGGRIDVDIVRTAANVRIAVCDTGNGLDPEFIPFAFERFRQGISGTTRAHGGLGLGLAIVRHLVELHGGTVRAENNQQGPGATFHVTLPALAVPANRIEIPAAVAPASVGSARARLDRRGVLVADDDPAARELLGVVLENAGAEVRAAASADDALMILQTWRPDVLLSDIEMPGEDGYSLIGRVRRLPFLGANLVAIALTAHARPDDRAKALSAGFQWHLAKPIDPGELIAVIAELMAQADEVDSPA